MQCPQRLCTFSRDGGRDAGLPSAGHRCNDVTTHRSRRYHTAHVHGRPKFPAAVLATTDGTATRAVALNARGEADSVAWIMLGSSLWQHAGATAAQHSGCSSTATAGPAASGLSCAQRQSSWHSIANCSRVSTYASILPLYWSPRCRCQVVLLTWLAVHGTVKQSACVKPT